ATPARSSDPVTAPIDVPTMTAASRASHPASARAASTPAWKACPTGPPAPRTSPTRWLGSASMSVIGVDPQHPAGGGLGEVVGMHDPRQDLEAVHESRPRSGEVRRCVHDPYLPGSPGRCLGQLDDMAQGVGLLHRGLQVVAA